MIHLTSTDNGASSRKINSSCENIVFHSLESITTQPMYTIEGKHVIRNDDRTPNFVRDKAGPSPHHHL